MVAGGNDPGSEGHAQLPGRLSQGSISLPQREDQTRRIEPLFPPNAEERNLAAAHHAENRLSGVAPQAAMGCLQIQYGRIQ